MRSETRHVLVAFLLLFVVCAVLPFFAHAQAAPSYWCGTYWSNTPCTYGGYGSTYVNPQTPQYSYYTYPNQYYPNNYNYYYPYQSYQYYYPPPPTCYITYSRTNNPNYSDGMHGEAITLTWSSNYATNAFITGIGATSAGGIQVVYPQGYTQFTMTVYGPGGTNTCMVYYQPAQYYPQNYWNQYNYNPNYQYYW